MLSGKQTLLIAATAVMLLAIIIYMVAKRKKMANMAFLSLILVVSGGVGNLIDRVAQGYVVDFIRFAFWNRFPTFNVADIAITVGVALLVIYILFIDGKRRSSVERRELTVTAEAAGCRLDKGVALLVPELSRSQIQTLAEKGSILKNGAAAGKRIPCVQAMKL